MAGYNYFPVVGTEMLSLGCDKRNFPNLIYLFFPRQKNQDHNCHYYKSFHFQTLGLDLALGLSDYSLILLKYRQKLGSSHVTFTA